MSAKQSKLVNHYIIEDFKKQLSRFGFSRFYYCILPCDNQSVAPEPCDPINFSKAVNINKMRFAVSSDAEILQYRDEFLSRFSKNDKGFSTSSPSIRKFQNPYLWPSNSVPQRQQMTFEQLLHRYEIASRLTFYQPLKNPKGWLGMFNLFSTLPNEEINQHLTSDGKELEQVLVEFADTFNSLALKSINPLINFRVLSPTCIQILELVAQGHSSDEIAKQIFMSERGVNYHLDRARSILEAKNRTNLISKAYQYGVLNTVI
ncbi:response regulator transcription factor [uncultured Shewanella sp.]|uniref:response regulator transcription factor n=1 Tax=uncultured Shewanella sp. TaxID=173975 RepID=UPI002624608E|nr:helix-turn-helix transcriptional regulator [uncultured Shewanella sp.]